MRVIRLMVWVFRFFLLLCLAFVFVVSLGIPSRAYVQTFMINSCAKLFIIYQLVVCELATQIRCELFNPTQTTVLAEYTMNNVLPPLIPSKTANLLAQLNCWKFCELLSKTLHNGQQLGKQPQPIKTNLIKIQHVFAVERSSVNHQSVSPRPLLSHPAHKPSHKTVNSQRAQ